MLFSAESDTASQGVHDKTSLRTMLAVIDYLRHQQRPLEPDGFVVRYYSIGPALVSAPVNLL